MLGLLGPGTPAAVAEPSLDSAGVIFVYHRFGEDAYPEESIRLDQFSAHLDEIEEGRLTPLPLDTLVDELIARRPLAPGTIALTIDRPRRSAVRHALPRLLERRIPVALLVAPAAVDRGGDTMTWEELQAAAARGAVIGITTARRPLLPSLDPDAWRREIGRAINRYREVFGTAPQYFAHPGGISTRAIEDHLRGRGLRAAFGDQSGPATAGLLRYRLPRFPMIERYGSRESFAQAARVRPFGLLAIKPYGSYLTEPADRIRLRLVEPMAGVGCSMRGRGRLSTPTMDGEWLTLDLGQPIEDGTTRITCAAGMQDPGGGRVPARRWLGLTYRLGG